MYPIEQRIMSNTTITPAAKLVFAVIDSHVSRGIHGVSYDSIAERTGLSAVTCCKCVKQLVKEGFLTISKSERGWNLYGVVPEPEEIEIDCYQQVLSDDPNDLYPQEPWAL